MEFEEYLKQELAKPVGDHYTPEGNSPRARVERGLLGEILWQHKATPRKLTQELREFDGFNTPVGWFIQLPLLLVLLPILPTLWGLHSHRSALAEFRREYENNQRLKSLANERKPGG